MHTSHIQSPHARNQHQSFTLPACRLIGVIAAGLNAYLTLRYAQSLWPDERFASTLMALVWEASLVCFAATGIRLLRDAALVRGFAFLSLAALQMAGSAQAAATFIDTQATAKDQAAIALARDHASALAAIKSLQDQIARTVGPHLLASLRAQEERIVARRKAQEVDGAALARGHALLEGTSALQTPESQHADVHQRIAVMMQLITIAAMLVGTTSAVSAPAATPIPKASNAPEQGAPPSPPGLSAVAGRAVAPRELSPNSPSTTHALVSAQPVPSPTCHPAAPAPVEPTVRRSDVTADLYQRARAQIAAGTVGPSNRALQRQFGLGWRGAKVILERMVCEGLLSRGARNYQLLS